MSHVRGIKLVVDDLAALAAAAKECGCELVKQSTYRWYGKWVNDYAEADAAYLSIGIKPEDYGKCEHAIRVVGNGSAYEAGVIKNPNGPGYLLIYDFYGPLGRQLEDCIGKNAAKLTAHYSANRLMAKAKSVGKTVGVTRENGKYRVCIR